MGGLPVESIGISPTQTALLGLGAREAGDPDGCALILRAVHGIGKPVRHGLQGLHSRLQQKRLTVRQAVEVISPSDFRNANQIPAAETGLQFGLVLHEETAGQGAGALLMSRVGILDQLHRALGATARCHSLAGKGPGRRRPYGGFGFYRLVLDLGPFGNFLSF